MSFNEWKEYKLGDLLDISSSKRIYAKEYTKYGVPFYRGKEIIEKFKGNDVSTELFISNERFYELKNKFGAPKKGDILLTSVGTLGIPYLVDEEEFYFKDGNLTWFRNFKTFCYNKFIYFWIQSEYGKNQIYSKSIGSTQKALTIDTLKKFEIKLPPLEEQKAIAKILFTLDEKIETNNQINKKLEEMAQAIFKQWFVDFEFPCIHENYKFSRAGKPDERHEFLGAGKPKDFEKVCTYKRVGGLPVPDGESWFVYVLLCEDETFYKGMTKDLYRRFYEHFTGIGAEYTKAHKPVKVIHYEQFATQEEARKREEELKSGYGREWIKREYAKYLQDEENIKQSIIENSGSPDQEYASESRTLIDSSAQEHTSTSRFNSGSPAREYTRKSKFMIAGEMVQSELGKIPKEWEIVELGDYVNIKHGYAFKSKFFSDNETDRILLTPGNFKIGGGFMGKKYKYYSMDDEINEDYILRKHDLIVTMTDLSKDGDTLGYPAFIPEIKGKILLHNQRLGRVENKEEVLTKSFLYALMCSKLYRHHILATATGTTVKHTAPTRIMEYKFALPKDKEILKRYDISIKRFKDKLNDILNENLSLSELMNIILPKLISGEIRVPLNN